MTNWGHSPWHILDKQKTIQCVNVNKCKNKIALAILAISM
jgi:hypothetical protein